MLKKLHVSLQVSVSFYKDRVNVCLHVHLYIKTTGFYQTTYM